MPSTYLQKTFSSAGDRKKWTWSGWVKRSSVDSSHGLFACAGSTNQVNINIESSTNGVDFWVYSSGAYAGRKTTNRKLRDCNGFYHIVCSYDSANATADDRMKIYINGERQTSFSTSTNPSQNLDGELNNNVVHQVGANGNGNNDFDGIMTHVHFTDGYLYDADTFGETDSTTGIWKPKTSPSVSYGTNGFFLDMADSSAMGNDISGNDNDFTVSGTMTQTIDTPSNVFATFNPLHSSETSATNFFTSLGNTELTTTNNDFGRQMGITLNPENMKGYFELKIAVDDNFQIHVQDIERRLTKTAYSVGSSNPTWMFDGHNIKYGNGSGWTTQISNYLSTANGDIVGIAFDFTGSNKNIWFHKNGTYGNNGSGVGNPATGDYPAITASNLNTADHYAFIFSVNTGSSDSSIQLNFGNGYFGTTAVSSAGTNSGIGTFEYDVPSGYKALCTKSINEQEYS